MDSHKSTGERSFALWIPFGYLKRERDALNVHVHDAKTCLPLVIARWSRNIHLRHRHKPVHTWPDLPNRVTVVHGYRRLQKWNRAWRGILDQTNFPVRSEKSVLRRWTALRSEREIELPRFSVLVTLGLLK